jgi:transcriptional regulator GlxA family with amidase domain
MNKSEITKIGFLIFPGFPMACLTSMIEPLRAANEIAGCETFSWVLVSETSDRVASSAKVLFEPDCTLSDAKNLDILFLLSSPVSQFENPHKSNSVLRAFERHGTDIGGISGGVFPLVRSGLMQGRRCSVHWCYEAAFQAEFPDVVAQDDVIVIDPRRYTVTGAAAAFDLALILIERRLGQGLANEVACWFQHPQMRGEGVQQKVPLHASAEPGLPDLVGRAVAFYAERLEEAPKIDQVAAELGVTPRQVERAFKKATGQSPSHYFRALRMKAARQLVLYSKDRISDIAGRVGYGSQAPLVTHYRDAFGVSPQEDRRNINAVRVKGDVPLPSI